MLVVLSEIDCLSYLQIHGVFPDEFFTDIDFFRNKMIVHTNVDILVIFAGSCAFKKRIVCELVTQLRSRLGKGVQSITVLSDIVLPSLNEYYKYDIRPLKGVLYNGYKKVGTEEELLTKFKGLPKKKAEKYLVNSTHGQRILTDSELKDDELLKVIKVPKLV